jgi:hypothetical protein
MIGRSRTDKNILFGFSAEKPEIPFCLFGRVFLRVRERRKQ